jgi:predicted RNA binding protein YcfA (HicA-like mRNA interferase family)
MPRLPGLNGWEVIRVLKKVGFTEIRQKGSHVFMRHPDGRTTLVPVHKGRDIDRGLLRKIIRDADMERDEFMDLL